MVAHNWEENGLFITLVSYIFNNVFLFVGLTIFYLILIDWFNKFIVQAFQPLTVIYREDNFVYQHCIYMYIAGGEDRNSFTNPIFVAEVTGLSPKSEPFSPTGSVLSVKETILEPRTPDQV